MERPSSPSSPARIPSFEMKQLNALMKWIRKALGTPVTVVVKLLPNGGTRKE